MDVLDRFEAEYQEVNDMSTQRRRDQLSELRKLAAFAGKPVEQCDAEDFSKYMAHLSSGKLHINTVAKRANMVRPFFTWGFSVGLIDSDTLMRVKLVRNPNGSGAKGLPRPYNRTEMRGLWASLDTKFPRAEEKFWKRWRKGTSRYTRIWREVFRVQVTAIIRLALDCGLRREEIYRLSIDDVHPDNAGVAVRRGKGGKPRQVPYTDAAREAVAEWLRVRKLLKPKHQHLWLSVMPNQPGGAKMVNRPASFESFEKFLRQLGRYELHRLRHTCATNWLRGGMKIHIVQKLLGHASIDQTLLYTKVLDDDVQVEVERHQKRFEEGSGANE